MRNWNTKLPGEILCTAWSPHSHTTVCKTGVFQKDISHSIIIYILSHSIQNIEITSYKIYFFSLDSLDDLTNLVIKLFSGVEDKNISVPEYPIHPYGDEQLQVGKKEHIRTWYCRQLFYVQLYKNS